MVRASADLGLTATNDAERRRYVRGLFIAQRLDGLDLCGSAGWDEAGEDAHDDQDCAGSCGNHGVVGFDLEEQVGKDPATEGGEHYSQN